MMLFGGPMLMTFGEYLSDIGITYLIIPVVTMGIGMAQSRGYENKWYDHPKLKEYTNMQI